MQTYNIRRVFISIAVIQNLSSCNMGLPDQNKMKRGGCEDIFGCPGGNTKNIKDETSKNKVFSKIFVPYNFTMEDYNKYEDNTNEKEYVKKFVKIEGKEEKVVGYKYNNKDNKKYGDESRKSKCDEKPITIEGKETKVMWGKCNNNEDNRKNIVGEPSKRPKYVEKQIIPIKSEKREFAWYKFSEADNKKYGDEKNRHKVNGNRKPRYVEKP